MHFPAVRADSRHLRRLMECEGVLLGVVLFHLFCGGFGRFQFYVYLFAINRFDATFFFRCRREARPVARKRADSCLCSRVHRSVADKDTSA